MDGKLNVPTHGAVTPADVRAAILTAEKSLHALRGFLPANVGVPLESAHGKLRVAWVAVDAWEAALRSEAETESGEGA